MTSLLAWVAGATLIVAGVAIWRTRYARQLGSSDAIRLITSRYLGGKRFLTIVEVDGERLLLGLAGDHVSLVTHLKRRDG